MEYYRDAPDIDLPDEKPRERKSKGKDDTREKGSCHAEPGFARIYINQGKATGCTPYNILDLINENVPGRINIGRIDLFTGYSLIDVEEKFARRVVSALKHADFYGNRIYAEIADPNKKYGGEGRRSKKEGKERFDKENERPGKERRNNRPARNEDMPRNDRGRGRRGESRFQNEERPSRRERRQAKNTPGNNEGFNYEIFAGKPKSRKRRK